MCKEKSGKISSYTVECAELTALKFYSQVNKRFGRLVLSFGKALALPRPKIALPLASRLAVCIMSNKYYDYLHRHATRLIETSPVARIGAYAGYHNEIISFSFQSIRGNLK